MTQEDKLNKVLSEIDREIEQRKDVSSYASSFTSEDAGKIEGLMLARKIIRAEGIY